MIDILDDGHPAAWADGVVMPALLRAAWRTYGGNVRESLAATGYDDLPRNGAFVIGAMANDGLDLRGDMAEESTSAAARLARQLGVSKQAVSKLLDTLVLRGYLERTPDPDNRRRMILTLAPRGKTAAQVVATANRDMDDMVESMLGADGLRALRRQLAAVIHVDQDRYERD